MNPGDVGQDQELSFETGLGRRRGERPEIASFKLRGPVASATRELYVDDDVQVIVMDADGQIIIGAYGVVSEIRFKKHRPARGRRWIERIHSITLGETSERDA